MKVFTLFFTASLLAATAVAQVAPANCPAPAADEARPWLNATYTPQCRAQFVLERLKTLDDKFAFLTSSGGGGAARGAGNTRNVMTELGLIRGGGSDGPAGVRGVASATAFPTPLTVAANFDP